MKVKVVAAFVISMDAIPFLSDSIVSCSSCQVIIEGTFSIITQGNFLLPLAHLSLFYWLPVLACLSSKEAAALTWLPNFSLSTTEPTN